MWKRHGYRQLPIKEKQQPNLFEYLSKAFEQMSKSGESASTQINAIMKSVAEAHDYEMDLKGDIY